MQPKDNVPRFRAIDVPVQSGPPPLDEGRGTIWECDAFHKEPELGRVAHGISRRVDRLRCLGNAVVPQLVEVIGRAIMECENQGNHSQ